MTLDQIFASGDRVEFKKYLEGATIAEVGLAWVMASKANVQDFQDLAFEKLKSKSGTVRNIL